MTFKFCAVAMMVTFLSSRTIDLASSSFSLLADVEGPPDHSASFTLVWPFLNISLFMHFSEKACGPHVKYINV